MSELNEVIAKSVELNNAIKKLNEETKIINSIVTEKRNAKKEDIMKALVYYKYLFKIYSDEFGKKCQAKSE